jgi:4-hydroxybenzoyl-CoA reductase subunit beta
VTRSLAEFEFQRASDVAQAVAIAAADVAGTRFIAGGTDLVPNMRHGLAPSRRLVDISALEELRGIAITPEGALAIGAATTLAQIASGDLVARHCPALAEAAHSVAAPQHRAAATLGGNLCQDTRCTFYNQGEWWRNANGYCLKYRGDRCHVAPQGDRCHAAFCSDLAAVLLAAGARADITGTEGTRSIALQDMYRDDGAAHLTLAPGELLVRVTVPRIDGSLAFTKLRQRGSIDFPLASVALCSSGDRVRIALAGTNSYPVVFDIDRDATDSAVRSAVMRHAACQRTTTTPANYRREAVASLALGLFKQAVPMGATA